MHVPSLGSPEERVLGRILRRQAEAIPDRTYLLTGEDHYSYGQVNAIASSHANALAALDVRRGDTVAFLMRSSEDFVFATYGAMKIGAIWIPTNVDYKGEWLRESLHDSRARVLCADADLLPRLAAFGERLPFDHVVLRGRPEIDLVAQTHDLASFREYPATEPDDRDLAYSDTAAVLWTSGTTGRAKGVMQSHNAWVRGAESGARTSGTAAGDVMYCCLPMHNSAAWVASVYRALVTGLPFALDPEFSVARFWDRCRHYGATQIFTLGAMHMFLWQAPERAGDADNPVRHATMIPFPDHLLEPFKQRFGLRTIDQGYGQSEVMGVCHRVDDGKPKKPGSLGTALPGVEIRLLDDDDREVPPGEVGEFAVRPTEPNVIFSGYFNDDAATVRAWRNLWYHTGDLGRRDEDGDYFFVDRKADFIRYKGRNVSSFAVEMAVRQHPAVADCAAHGVTSEELETEAEMKVVVVLKAGQKLEAAELARFINENAPYFFVPRYIEFVGELPCTPTGRVQKFKLRERGVTPATWDARQAGFIVKRD
jgi:crotonobetaine/carnitine-CoA ligase